MRISDWSSDVCSSDLVTDREAGHVPLGLGVPQRLVGLAQPGKQQMQRLAVIVDHATPASPGGERILEVDYAGAKAADVLIGPQALAGRSEEHTSALQSLMRTPYPCLCLKTSSNICILQTPSPT